MSKDKPGVYAYATGYAGKAYRKTTSGGRDVCHVKMTVPAYRDTDPDEVYDICAWGDKAELLSDVLEGALFKVSGYLRPRSWEAEGATHFEVQVSAYRVEILELPEPRKAPEAAYDDFSDDSIPF